MRRATRCRVSPSERACSEMAGTANSGGDMLRVRGLELARLPSGPVHLAIGMFDGVHRGHRAVIGAAVEAARNDGGIGAVLTFSPHPSVLFRPAQPTLLLQPEEAKAVLMQECGVRAVITQPFTAEFAARSDAEFVAWLQSSVPQLRAVYVGENFRFGRGRAGTPESLASHAAALGFAVHCLPRVEVQGAVVSSTRIRDLVARGEIAAANELLGRPYRAGGAVEPGKRLGRTLGFPTLNLAWAPPLAPRLGVYVARIRGQGGGWQPAVANYGLRPTVESAVAPRLEVHVLAACSLREGDAVEVEWLDFVRPERKFAGLPELVAQIGLDSAAARAWFEAREIA